MPAAHLKIDAINPEAPLLDKAARALRAGGVIALPTDTVYGLVADPWNPSAVSRIYKIKGREAHKPLILLAADMEMVLKYCPQTPAAARAAMARFWPGALTAIVPAPAEVPAALLAGGDRVGWRAPDHAVAQSLIRQLGIPLASTSANRSNAPAATAPAQIMAELSSEIEMVMDAGPTPLGRESTIVDFTGDPPRLLREGCLARPALEHFLGPLL